MKFENFRRTLSPIFDDSTPSNKDRISDFTIALCSAFLKKTKNNEQRDGEFKEYFKEVVGFYPTAVMSGILNNGKAKGSANAPTLIGLYFIAKYQPEYEIAIRPIESALFGKRKTFESVLLGQPSVSSEGRKTELVQQEHGVKESTSERASPPEAGLNEARAIPKSGKFAFFRKKDTSQSPPRQDQPITTPASFPVEGEADRLRGSFRNIAVTPAKVECIAGSKVGRWQVIKQWDASHHVPKRGSGGPKFNPPQSIAWRPDGKSIGLSCDNSGNCIFDITDGPRFPPDWSELAYGDPQFSFWSHDGRFFVSLVETSQNEHWIISDGSSYNVGVFLNLPNLFGESTNRSSGYNFVGGRDPFRPGSKAITLLPWQDNQIRLLDLNEVKELDGVAKVEWRDRSVAVLDLSPLGAFEDSCFRYHWHPSGLYIAVTTCSANEPHKKATSTHVVELSSGKIIGSVRDGFTVLAWSPTTQKLLTFRRPDSAELGETDPVFRLLDLTENAVSESKSASDFGLWAKRAAIQNVPNGLAVNANGNRVFKREYKNGEASSEVRPVLQVINISGDEPVVEMEIDGEVADADWSPIDPNCFVTAGGFGHENDVRIWAVE